MRTQMTEKIEIPEEVTCEYSGNTIKCKKGSDELSRKIGLPGVNISVKDNNLIFDCPAGNKNDFKKIKSNIAHMRNLFYGLTKGYTYHLESCNVHFPMTLKVEGDKLVINNFLGEKTPRFAKILPGAKVEIKGQKITITSADKEIAGHTAANLERATKVKKRDRRVFQDGIFIVEKPTGDK